MPGGSLEEQRNLEKYRAPERAVELMIKVARAVQFAHAHGVWHCDLKPANVLFDEHGEPHVSDFGLARAIDECGTAPTRRHAGGTPEWESTEIAAGAPSDTRSGKSVACIGRVYRSTTDRHLKLGISAPLRDVGGRFIGVVQASIDARESFGGLQMKCGQGECVSALIGPRDRDAPGAVPSESLAVLAHPALKPPRVTPFQERRTSSALAHEICGRLDCRPDLRDPLGRPRKDAIVIDDFEDPVTSQVSMAALAPVGRTGLIVVVATPYSAVDDIVESIGRAASLVVALALICGVMTVGAVLAAPRVLRRYRQRRPPSRRV